MVPVLNTHIVNRDNVGVHQAADNFGFTQEPLTEGFILSKIIRQNLKRHLALEAFLNGQVDGRHPAFAQRSQQPVTAQVEPFAATRQQLLCLPTGQDARIHQSVSKPRRAQRVGVFRTGM